MEISVIASGSNGNCCLVQHKAASILIDAGKSGREIESRMHQLGKSIEDVDAILLTHSHSDHIHGAGVLSRRYNIPIYSSHQLMREAAHKLGRIIAKQFTEKPFRINNLKITPIPTSHCVLSYGFVIDKFGLFTDTGIVTKQMVDVFPRLRAVLLESNHDIDMLINGPYPFYLKQWILSDTGHLSNINASQLVQEKGDNLQLALLGHLSGNNNTPEVVRATFESLVKRKVDHHVCSRDEATGSFVL